MTTVSQLISVFVSNHESYKDIRQPKRMKPPMAPPTAFLSGHGMQSWHQRFGDAGPWGFKR